MQVGFIKLLNSQSITNNYLINTKRDNNMYMESSYK